jgi:hypothetical protein
MKEEQEEVPQQGWRWVSIPICLAEEEVYIITL